jgi:hypothetical protein
MGKRKQTGLARGMITGLTGGVAGTLLMDGYWKVVRNTFGDRPEQKPKPGDDNQAKDQPSTQIVADKLSEALTGREVPEEGKAVAGIATHYALGLGCGALFGAVAARWPRLGLLAGMVYGAGIWLFLDEIGLRMLKVAPEADKVPVSQHVQALGAHLVYGAATALVTKRLLK